MSDNAPITEELRDAMKRYDNFDGTSRVVLGESNFDRLCDAIDTTHANLERENAKLRKVANLISEYISYDRCDGCVVKTACNSHELDVCWMVTKLRNQLRERGVKVDGWASMSAFD